MKRKKLHFKSSNKFIVILLLLSCIMSNSFAQTSKKYSVYDNGGGWYTCFADTYNFSCHTYPTSGLTSGGIMVKGKQNMSPQLSLAFTTTHKTLVDIAHTLQKTQFKFITQQTIEITLSNGETFTTKEGFLEDCTSEKGYGENSATFRALTNLAQFSSSQKALKSLSSKERVKYVAKQLCLYNIRLVEIKGISILYNKDAPTKYTLKAMLRDLCNKTGESYYKPQN